MVKNGLLDMAGQVGVSSDDLARGMFMIESAGYHGAAGLAVLKSAAEGAKVGGADLATTADAVTTVMRDYHMSANQAGDATNFLVSVVSQGKTHMQDLAGSLAAVLPFASALHIPLDQVGGAMATMTSRGVPAANAATYLRFTMAALANETPKGKKALEELGLSSDKIAKELTTRGLLPTMETINAAISKKFPAGSAQAMAALSAITGGTRGLSAALQLTGGNLNDFIAATAAVKGQITEAHGAVLGWAEVQGDTNQKMSELSAGLDAAAIRIGTKLLPYVNQLISAVTPLIPKVADLASRFIDFAVKGIEETVNWLKQFKPEMDWVRDNAQTLSVIIGAVAAGFILWNVALAATRAAQLAIMAIQFIGGVIQIVRSVGLWTAAQWLLNVALDANPIGVIVIAIAALVAGVIWAYKNVGWFRDGVNAAWDGIKRFGEWIWTWLKPVLDWLGDKLGDLKNGLDAVGGWLSGGSGGSTRAVNPARYGGHRQSGGAVSQGSFYLVGEGGPELFAPGSSGSIIPAVRGPGTAEAGVSRAMLNVLLDLARYGKRTAEAAEGLASPGTAGGMLASMRAG